MVDKQLDNNNLEPAVPESPELSDEQLEKLIQPWLGDGINFKDLPIPRN